MRNRPLYDALRAFSVEAARLLTRDLEAGAELPFEVAEVRGAASPLYRYRPLTGRFVAERWERLRALASFEPAQAALGDGAAAYLRRLGATGADAEPALQVMLERLYEDLTSFAFPEERFERVYLELERALYAGTARGVVVAPVNGLVFDVPVADLGDELSLAPAAGLDAPVPRSRPGEPPAVVCRLERRLEGDDGALVEEAPKRFRLLLTALRLLGAGGAGIGPLAFSRVDESPWQPLALPTPPRGRGPDWRLSKVEAAELEELLRVLDAPSPHAPVRWALARFDMGCDRPSDLEALTDYLLALRGLLDGGEGVGRASLPLRVAALCAEEPARRVVQRQVELAFELERFVVGGGEAGSYADVIGSESARRLLAEVEDHVRGLLRDVLCGYLEPDLAAVADDILLRSAEPLDIRARDTRAEPAAPEPAAPAPAAPPAGPAPPSPPAPPAGPAPPTPPATPEGRDWVATAGMPPAPDRLADWDFDP